MTSVMSFGRAAILGLAVIAFSVGGAKAQVAPPPGVAEVNTCLCLQQAVGTLSADMNAKTQAMESVNHQLADLDTQLAQEKPQVNVNNPDSVAHYKALLEQHDAAYRQSIGPVHADADRATTRYNASVNEYNTRCANRPWVGQAQVPLVCPPLQ